MTRLTRVTGKVFGGDATATGENPEIGQFGSALAGTYNGTTDVSTIQNLPAWGQGWAGAVTPDTNFPALPEMTGFGKVLSYQNNYLLQNGMAEWDSGTIYYINQFCRVGNKIYYSLTDENQGNNPESDTTNWASYNGLFADINASNFTSQGTTYLSGLGKPSNRYINLSLGASGSTYTAPANGYFFFRIRFATKAALSNGYYYTSLINQTIGFGINSSETRSVSAGGITDIMLYLPVKRGEVGRVAYDAQPSQMEITASPLRFYYDEGAPSA